MLLILLQNMKAFTLLFITGNIGLFVEAQVATIAPYTCPCNSWGKNKIIVEGGTPGVASPAACQALCQASVACKVENSERCDETLNNSCPIFFFSSSLPTTQRLKSAVYETLGPQPGPFHLAT